MCGFAVRRLGGSEERSGLTYGYEVCSAFPVTVDIADCVSEGFLLGDRCVWYLYASTLKSW